MAIIKISDLSPVGSELFKDSESFMNELGDGELGAINGAGWSGWKCAATIASLAASSTFCLIIVTPAPPAY